MTRFEASEIACNQWVFFLLLLLFLLCCKYGFRGVGTCETGAHLDCYAVIVAHVDKVACIQNILFFRLGAYICMYY